MIIALVCFFGIWELSRLRDALDTLIYPRGFFSGFFFWELHRGTTHKGLNHRGLTQRGARVRRVTMAGILEPRAVCTLFVQYY